MGGAFDILTDQHRELEEHLERLLSVTEPEDAGPLLMELLELLRLHSRLEERCFHPWVARVEGRFLAREWAEDHLTLRELMDEVEELPLGHPEWQSRLMTLGDRVVAHIREEEDALPRLLKALDPQDQEDARWELVVTLQELLARRAPGPVSGSGPLLETLRWDG